MERIIEQAEFIIQQAKVQQVSLEVKDKLILDLKAKISVLETLLKESKANTLLVWVQGVVQAPNVVKWSLHLSHAVETDLLVKVQHTDTKTALLTPYTWTVPKGRTEVSGIYPYTNVKTATFQLEAGEGYTVPATIAQPKSITLSLLTAPVASAGIEYKPPLVITKGGTYSGNFQSTDSEIPAIDIKTNEPVIIETSNIRGAGYLIRSWYNNSSLEVRNTNGYGITPTAWKEYKKPRRFVIVSEFAHLLIEDCYLEQTAGILVGGKYSGNGSTDTIKIRRNKVKNIDGRIFQGVDIAQFVQFNFRGIIPGVEIAFNEVLNEYGNCHVEDNVNIFNTKGKQGSPIKIYSNLIQGAFYAPGITKAYTGGGILSDAPSFADATQYVEVYDNYIIGTGNYSLGIAGGNNLRYHHNYCVNAGVLPDGSTFASKGINASGIWANDYYRNGNTHSNVYEANTVGISNGVSRMDGSMLSTLLATFKDNVKLPNPITKATEQLYVAKWNAMMKDKGYR